MWFGTSANILLRWRNGEFTNFTLPIEQSVGFDTIVFPGDAGKMWVGSVQNGVLSLSGDQFTRPFPVADIGTVARVIYRDHRGGVWIGNEFGLFYWEQEKLKRFAVADGFTAAFVLAITEDPAGNIWIGTGIGELWRYRDGNFKNFRPSDTPTDAQSFAAAAAADPLKDRSRGALTGGERFWALHADAEGVVWIGTLGGGLLRFQDGKFTRYTPRDGLPSEHITQILEDQRGQLWLGTQNGIARASKVALNEFARGAANFVRFVTYGKLDGLPTAECSGGNQPACWRSRDGRLWFATIKGAVWVNPAELPLNSLPPPVVIEEISVDGQRLSEDGQPSESPAVPVPARLRIPAGRHYLDFKFTALSLTSPDKVRFKWRLAGLEQEWVRESSRRSVSYSFVPPGDYEFQVQACNNDGVWNETGATIKLTVLPYFWQTRWFSLVATLGLVAATAVSVWLGLRARHRRRLARLEVLRATELERSRIARDLHDELGSGLTEVTMLTATFPGANLAPEKLRERLQRAGNRAHALVDALDEIVWAVDPGKDNLPALAKYFAGHVEEYLKESNIACLVQMPVTFPVLPVSAELRHQLFLAVREAVNNAVRHARPGRIGFALELAGERQLQIAVTDDGRGFDPATVAPGNGLANLRTRLASVGGRCEIISQPGGGTTVRLTVTLPDKN
jgi:signal transduction histidine kinase